MHVLDTFLPNAVRLCTRSHLIQRRYFLTCEVLHRGVGAHVRKEAHSTQSGSRFGFKTRPSVLQILAMGLVGGTHEGECTLRGTDGTHTVVDAAWA